jgi:hypothetical protein
MLPRGQGKTSLTAVLALFELLAGAEGAQVVVVATDERQAGLCFRAASRMVELHPALEARVQVYTDQLTVPARGSSFQVLPAVPKRLEGLDYTLAIVDEAGRVDTEVYEVVTLATGKQQSSVVLAIGTPGPELEQTVLGRLRSYALDHPADPLAVWREHSAAGFEDHPADCRHCWELANPAGGDFLAWDGLEACLPPKMREASFRRARLCQLTDQLEDAWLPPSAWAACADATRSIPDGAEVVLAFDGSFNGDTTVLVVATVGQRPHIDLVELWDAAGRQVPRRRRRAGHPGRVPALAGAGNRRRPVPVGALAPAPGGRGPADPGVSPVTRPDDAGHRPVLRSRREWPAHPLGGLAARPARRQRRAPRGRPRRPTRQGAEGLTPADRRRGGRRHGP